MEHTETELAYIAGIVDGEGYIGFNKRKNGTLSLRITVTNTNLEILEWLESRFGGSVQKHMQPQGNRKESYIWTVAALLACDFLKHIRKYMRIKARQADLAIIFSAIRAERGNVGKELLSEDDYAREAFIHQQITILNKRGTN